LNVTVGAGGASSAGGTSGAPGSTGAGATGGSSGGAAGSAGSAATGVSGGTGTGAGTGTGTGAVGGGTGAGAVGGGTGAGAVGGGTGSAGNGGVVGAAGAVGTAGTSGTAGSGGMSGGGVPCGSTTCAQDTETCCVQTVNGSLTNTCIPAGEQCLGGGNLGCVAGSCGDGRICCLSLVGMSTGCSTAAQCSNGVSTILCTGNSDCPSDRRFCCASIGVNLCRSYGCPGN
jgi:hypothetical protein